MLLIMHRAFCEIDAPIRMCRLYEIPDFAFKANIGDETLTGFCINEQCNPGRMISQSLRGRFGFIRASRPRSFRDSRAYS